MSDWDGTVKVSWRLGVLVAILGSVIGGAFWAGRFTDRVDNMEESIATYSAYSRAMGLRVNILRELEAADSVGDKAVEKRLERIERALVRIESLLRSEVRSHNEQETGR